MSDPASPIMELLQKQASILALLSDDSEIVVHCGSLDSDERNGISTALELLHESVRTRLRLINDNRWNVEVMTYFKVDYYWLFILICEPIFRRFSASVRPLPFPGH